MSNTRTELLKLARALGKSGYAGQSNVIMRLAEIAAEVLDDEVVRVWEKFKPQPQITSSAAGPKAAEMFWEGVGSQGLLGMGGTIESKMLAALWLRFTQEELDKAAPIRDWKRNDYPVGISAEALIKKETSGQTERVMLSLLSKRVNSSNFNPHTGEFIEKDTPKDTSKDARKEAPPVQKGITLSDVQSKMIRMDARNIDGTPLVTDGDWGKNTSAAWNKLTGDATTATVPVDLTPTEALKKLTDIASSTAAPATPAATSESQASAVSASTLGAYWKFPEEDKLLNLTKRDALLKEIGRTTKTSKPYSGYTPASQAKISAAYLEDIKTNPNMEMILEDSANQESAQAKPQFNASDFFATDDIRMRKSDGGLFYVPDPAKPNTIAPLSQRSPDFLNQREQRRLMAEVRREFRSDPAKRRMYRQKISGQRKSERGLTRAEQAAGRARAYRGTAGLTGA